MIVVSQAAELATSQPEKATAIEESATDQAKSHKVELVRGEGRGWALAAAFEAAKLDKLQDEASIDSPARIHGASTRYNGLQYRILVGGLVRVFRASGLGVSVSDFKVEGL